MKNKKLDTLGKRIANARKDAGLTQSEVADKLNVSFQAVSLWEADETTPTTWNLIELAKLLGVSVSSLVENRGDYIFKTQDHIFDLEHMASFIRHTARAKEMHNTLKALDFAIKAHEGQTRKNTDLPYIYHPLNLACHCFALKIEEDDVVAACLLHDVVEDCGYKKEELPVDDDIKELVALLSHTKEDNRDEMVKKYFKGISKNAKAALVKCLDRCNNLTTMSWGLSREKIYRYINETETYILPLLTIVKKEPKYYNAAWLLRYQIESMLDIYKRLM